MNKKLSERLAMLEEMGFDTSKYNVVINKDKVAIIGADKYVEDKQIDNKKLFRRWITAQTFKMLYEPSYNYKRNEWEKGWDAYLRNRYDYKYQFTVMLEEVRVLAKLEVKDKEEFVERSNFFTKDVVVALCKHYIRQFDKYATANFNEKKGYVKLAKYGDCDMVRVGEIEMMLNNIVEDIKNSENYAEIHYLLKKFMASMNKIPADTPKCPEWKTAFKGSGAYYTLKNLLLFHGCLLRGCSDKQESMEQLTSYLDEYKGKYWRFHYMLLDIIELNNFDLRESIRRHQ